MKAFLAALLVLAGPGHALTLDFPGNAALQTQERESPASYALPTGGFDGQQVPTQTIAGAVTAQAWRVDAGGLTPVQLLMPLKAQIIEAGFEIIFECSDEACGGFDFRFATRVLPPPEMRVDLGDFRFVAAVNPETEEAVSLLASRSPQAGWVQVISVAPEGTAAPVVAAVGDSARSEATQVTPQGAMAQLESTGRAILDGVSFETGSVTLGAGPIASLQTLAAHLLDRPDLTVALVGHTDAEGSLSGNIAISKRRAAAVLERLVGAYGVPRRQLEAQGNGYLSPIADNRTEAGREANRRVEVIVTSVE